jgi:hypothetical protein
MLMGMIREHTDNILTECRHPATKAMAEGLHIKIKATKRRACGYCNEKPFKSKLCGSLGLRSQKLVLGPFGSEKIPEGFCS